MISLNLKIQTVALGGIRKKNIKLVKLTKNKSAAFQTFIGEI
jgi:hypothetical protein